MEAFFSFVKELYAAPFNQFDYSGDRDLLMTVMLFVMIYGITALIAVPFCMWAYSKIKWYVQRKHCQHAECDNQWTTDVSQLSGDPYCRVGQPCCDYCHNRHIDDTIQREADSEIHVPCPLGHGEMKKVVQERIIRDVCPTCRGVFLDIEELQRINELMHDRGYDSGHSAGTSSGVQAGLLYGIPLGVMIDPN